MSTGNPYHVRWPIAFATVLCGVLLVAGGSPDLRIVLPSWASTGEPVLREFDSTSQRSMWPRIYGQIGPYDVQTESELGDVARAGFHFALLNDAAAFSGGVSQYNISYIDTYSNWKMYTLCHSEIVQTGGCSQVAQDAVIQGVAERVAKNVAIDHVVGYWILDDYPGADIRPLLRKIHALVARANLESAFPRATLCEFANVQSTVNFDPDACDIAVVAIYTAKDRSPKDWSLRQRLPQILDALHERGWDQKKTPLMGILQTFGNYEGLPWALPSETDVAAQAEAYCKAGAIALLAYAWHDSITKPGASLRNTPSLLRGLQAGQRLCTNKYWAPKR